MAHRLDEAGLSEQVRVDSAGTGAWHVGDPPDARSVEVASRRGITLHGRARRVAIGDFHDFDYILAMDRSNLRDLQQVRPEGDGGASLQLLREFDPQNDGDLDVPDPYYGGPEGFDLMFEMIDRTCAAFVDYLSTELAN